jgi:hypothetical protein
MCDVVLYMVFYNVSHSNVTFSVLSKVAAYCIARHCLTLVAVYNNLSIIGQCFVSGLFGSRSGIFG